VHPCQNGTWAVAFSLHYEYTQFFQRNIKDLFLVFSKLHALNNHQPWPRITRTRISLIDGSLCQLFVSGIHPTAPGLGFCSLCWTRVESFHIRVVQKAISNLMTRIIEFINLALFSRVLSDRRFKSYEVIPMLFYEEKLRRMTR